MEPITALGAVLVILLLLGIIALVVLLMAGQSP